MPELLVKQHSIPLEVTSTQTVETKDLIPLITSIQQMKVELGVNYWCLEITGNELTILAKLESGGEWKSTITKEAGRPWSRPFLGFSVESTGEWYIGKHCPQSFICFNQCLSVGTLTAIIRKFGITKLESDWT